MKKTFPIFLGCLLILGCKKNPFDYRTKFIGDYNFRVHEQIRNLNDSNKVIVDTSYSYSGDVDYGKNNNTVVITFSKNNSLEAILYEEGSLELLYGYGSLHGDFESTTEIKFSYADYEGLGTSIGYDVSGVKK